MRNHETMNDGRSYCVVYRTGGTERFEWKRTFPKAKQGAYADCADIERMGYKAFVVDYEQSMRIGLPETFDAGWEVV